MMKILALAPYKFLPAENGGQKAIEGLYSSLATYADLTCVSTANNDLSVNHGFELLPLFSNSKLRYADVFSVYSLTRFIRKRNITHLIIEHPYMGWLALQLRKATGIKLIVHSHNIEGERFRSMKKWWAKYLSVYEKRIHQKADLSLFITEEDRQYAVRNFNLEENKTLVAPFAVDLYTPPTDTEKHAAKNAVCNRHSINAQKKLLVFAGAFNYKPNLEGLEYLLNEIIPALNNLNYNYRLIVCGKDVPDYLLNQNPEVCFTGFVQNIHEYYCGADVFVNPITTGGGIKTKLVEALGNNCNAVSTVTGAIGVPSIVTEEKLKIVDDNDSRSFAQAIVESHQTSVTPASFFDYFNAHKIADRIIKKMENLF